MTFNEISGENVTYGDIKNDKKQSFWNSFQTVYFETYL